MANGFLRENSLCKQILTKIISYEDYRNYVAPFMQDRRSLTLDIGCGNGRTISDFTQTLNRQLDSPLTLVGLEVSPEKARKTKAKFQIQIVIADALNLPFREASFDMITNSHVLEHLKDANQGILEICRVLKGSGLLVLLTPNAKRITQVLYRIATASFEGYPLNPDHIHEFTEKELFSLFQECGFPTCSIRALSVKVRFFGKEIPLKLPRKYCDSFVACLIKNRAD